MKLKISKKIIATLILPLAVTQSCANLGLSVSAYQLRPSINAGQYTRDQLLQMMTDEFNNYQDALNDYYEFCNVIHCEEMGLLDPNDIEDEVAMVVHPAEEEEDDLLYQALSQSGDRSFPFACGVEAAELWSPGGIAYNVVTNNEDIYDDQYLIDVINKLRDAVDLMDSAMKDVTDARRTNGTAN